MDTNLSPAADAADSIVRTCQWSAAGLVTEVPTRRGAMAVFRHDSGALTFSLACYGEWAENEISFLHRFIPAGGVVLDVGAYIGTHSLAFAAAAGPAGRVIAFEAQPDSFALLVNNLAVNGAETVEARLGAVGAPGGSATLALPAIDIRSPHSFGSATLSDAHPFDPGQGVTVPTICLDQLGLERCDLVKIDAEGMESAVLEGAI
ncbi:MAG: FkbM family methyltransferase, partial [Acetobacteraceae bacterium]